jgi:hypothetical protein
MKDACAGMLARRSDRIRPLNREDVTGWQDEEGGAPL